MSGLRVVLAVVATMLITPTAVWASPSANSIANGDGESGLNGRRLVAGAPTALGYDVGGGYPTADDPGPARPGAHFFAGGETPRGTLRQRVALPNKVPSGSRTAVVTLQMTRSGGGTSDDGYADNPSLVIGGC